METIARKKFIYIVGVVVVLIVLIMILAALQQTKTTSLPTSQTFPTITPFEPNVTARNTLPGTTTYNESFKQIQQQEAKIVAQDAALGRLLEFLPHTGTNFSMKYDYNQNTFFVTIPQARRQEGEKELDAFLKQNGVQNRNWINTNKLVITYEE